MTQQEISAKCIKSLANDLYPSQKLGLARWFYEQYIDTITKQNNKKNV